MKATTKIRIDLTRPNTSVRVDAVQGDGNTRCVEVKLLSGGKAWEPPEGTEAAVTYRKPDHTKGLYNKLADGTPAVTVNGSVVTVILAPQMLTVPGQVKAGIVFNNAQLDQLTTFPFDLQVHANPFDGAQISEDYMRLQWLEDKLAEYIAFLSQGGIDVNPDTIGRLVEEYLKTHLPSGGTVEIQTDKTLTYRDGVLRVNTTNVAETNNTLPITSAGVNTIVGNIGAILDTI